MLDIDPTAFAEGLKVCVESCQGQKVFGAVHGYYGNAAQAPIEANGGKFSFIIRHPIKRLSSLFSYYYLQSQNLNGHDFANSEDMYKYISDLLPNIRITSGSRYMSPYMQPNLKRFSSEWFKKTGPNQITKLKSLFHKNIMGRLEIYGGYAETQGEAFSEGAIECMHLFSNMCAAILYYDCECFSSTDNNQAIMMEEMVQSPEYFSSQVLKNLPSSIEFDQKYLGDIFKIKPVNTHSLNTLDVNRIYSLWPQPLRDIYEHIFSAIGGDRLEEMYSTFGYKLP